MVASELAGSTTVLRDKQAVLAAVPDACAGCPLVTVLVCRKCKGSDKVVDFLKTHSKANVKTVRCQKVCEGPVAGLFIKGRMEWFGRLKGSKQLVAIAELTFSPDKVPKTLRKRMSQDRSGCKAR